MSEIYSKYQNSNNILEHFEFYDMRQENYKKNIQAKKIMAIKNFNNNKWIIMLTMDKNKKIKWIIEINEMIVKYLYNFKENLFKDRI